MPGSTSVTVDGLPATRIDPTAAGQDAILVAGRARTAVGSHVHGAVPRRWRRSSAPARMCDQILRTLKVTR